MGDTFSLPATAADYAKEVPLWDDTFGYRFANHTIVGERTSQIIQYSKKTEKKNDKKVTTYTRYWTTSEQSTFTCSTGCAEICQGRNSCTLNDDPGFPTPCSAGSTSCSDKWYNDAMAGYFTLSTYPDKIWPAEEYYGSKKDDANQRYTDYTPTADKFQKTPIDSWTSLSNQGWYTNNSPSCGLLRNSNNAKTQKTSCDPTQSRSTTQYDEGDAKVHWVYAGPSQGVELVSILATQDTTTSLKRYKSSKDYEIIYVGNKSSDDLLDQIKEEIDGRVWAYRILTFFGLWLGFRLMGGIVDIFTDFLPCGFDGVFDCILCCLACIPATVIWCFFFAIAWLTFRPVIGIPFLIICCCLCGGGGYYYYMKREEKRHEEANKPFNDEEPVQMNNNGGAGQPQAQTEPTPQQNNSGPGIMENPTGWMQNQWGNMTGGNNNNNNQQAQPMQQQQQQPV
eukprot:UN01934